MEKFIAISAIQTDGLQVRVKTDEATVAEYQEAAKEGATLPPISVFADDTLPGVYYLADGFHRLAAAARSGAREIAAEIHDGGKVAALRAALAANAAHGLRRSREDKTNAIKKAWENRFQVFGTSKPSAREIAAACNVSHPMVTAWLDREGIRPQSTPPAPSWTPPPPLDEAEGWTEDVEEVEESAPAKKEETWQEFYSATTAEDHLIEPPVAPNKVNGGNVLDAEGRAIPPEIIATWNNRRELNKAAATIADVEREIKELLDAKNPVMIGFNSSAFFAEADKVKSRLRGHVPHAVCPYCQGIGDSSCKACKGRGFVTKTQWTSGIPAELKG